MKYQIKYLNPLPEIKNTIYIPCIFHPRYIVLSSTSEEENNYSKK